MRNIARAEDRTASREFLGQKFSEMVSREPWRQSPSVGFLEAFDVPVFLGGTNLVPTLSACVRDQANPAIAHAGFLALDRLVIREPESVLAALLYDPAQLTGREQTHANYFARADPAQPAQRQLLEQYLLEPSRSAAEVQAFAGVFPNANFMISHNLLTQPVSMTHDELIRRDRVALLVIQKWLADPRFNHLKTQLAQAQNRLQDFVNQAARGR